MLLERLASSADAHFGTLLIFITLPSAVVLIQ
jgi:hypothetical protein